MKMSETIPEFIDTRIEKIKSDIEYHTKRYEKYVKVVINFKSLDGDYAEEISDANSIVNFNLKKVNSLNLELCVFYSARDLTK